MSQLNAASQTIKSHVAVRAESGTLVVVNHIRPRMIYPQEAQRGVWMLRMCICLCGHVVLVCSFVAEICALGVLRSGLLGFSCRQRRCLPNLGICVISLKGAFQGQCTYHPLAFLF